jgi:hypothetical protein
MCFPTKHAIVSRKMEEYVYDYENDYVYVYGTGDTNRHEPARIDYSVLSVVVMTLGPIMMVLSIAVMMQGLITTVEVCRRIFRYNLDHAAMGRTFFTVLKGVYAECKHPFGEP